MFICTRMTLAQFGRLATTEEDALPVDQIALLLKDVAGKKARLDAVKAKLDALLVRRYGSATQNLREAVPEMADTVAFVDGDFIVTANLQREVKWDQTKLAKLAEIIFHDWRLDPEEYINISYTVDEQTYLAWPPDLRKHFEDARALSAGEPDFDITGVQRSKQKAGVGKRGTV